MVIFFILELSPESYEFQQLARKFIKDEVIPVAAHHDRTGEYPWDIIKKAHALGLMNGHVPEEYGKKSASLKSSSVIRYFNTRHSGGMSLSNFDGCLIAEEFSYGCSGIGTAVEANGLGVIGCLINWPEIATRKTDKCSMLSNSKLR